MSAVHECDPLLTAACNLCLNLAFPSSSIGLNSKNPGSPSLDSLLLAEFGEVTEEADMGGIGSGIERCVSGFGGSSWSFLIPRERESFELFSSSAG